MRPSVLALPDDDEDPHADQRRKEMGEAAAVALDGGASLEVVFAAYDFAKANGLAHAEMLARLRNPRQSLH